MKKSLIAIFALAALVSCRSLIEEWQPVFTFDANEPGPAKVYTEQDLAEFGFPGSFATIKAVKNLYATGPVMMGSAAVNKGMWIKGQITSSDITGNIYREIYIQDGTGAINLKLGKSSLYSEYTVGQWLYVKCDGLTLGSYKDMPQLGLAADETETNEYETSYIDLQTIINEHVFPGEQGTPITPTVLTEADITAALSGSNPGFKGEPWGKLVKVEGLTYSDQIFALIYPNPSLPHKSGNPENRVFLSVPQYADEIVSGFDYTWGINTWGLTKQHFKDLIAAGMFDSAQVGSGSQRYGTAAKTLGDKSSFSEGTIRELLTGTAQEGKIAAFGADADLTYKEVTYKYATANYVSHYFKKGSTNVQIRTSGYSKFADDVLSTKITQDGRSIDAVGILTIYEGAAQLSLVTAPDDKDNPSIVIK